MRKSTAPGPAHAPIRHVAGHRNVPRRSLGPEAKTNNAHFPGRLRWVEASRLWRRRTNQPLCPEPTAWVARGYMSASGALPASSAHRSLWTAAFAQLRSRAPRPREGQRRARQTQVLEDGDDDGEHDTEKAHAHAGEPDERAESGTLAQFPEGEHGQVVPLALLGESKIRYLRRVVSRLYARRERT